jgi:diacylglycerol kinase (ATP)
VPTLAQAHADGMSRLVLAGGDGLIHLSLPALAETDVVLGIVPVGTGNDFARALGLPTKLNLAVTSALAEPTKVDLIATGEGRWAASIVTGGFSGQVNARANRLRFPPGQQRYTLATLLELAGLHTIGLTLDIDGTVEELQTTLFAIANTRFFGGGMAICPDASPRDGLLDITVVGPTSRRVLAWLLPSVFSGRHVNHPAVRTWRGHQVQVTTTAQLWADGEPFTGASFSAAPGVLRVAGSLVGT